MSNFKFVRPRMTGASGGLLLQGARDTSHIDWRPSEPPSLTGVRTVRLNVEATGLKWWKGDRPIAISIGLPNGTTYYLPWGHNGGNLDEAIVKMWCLRELWNKHIENINTKFDIHMLRVWGVDLEAQGCTFSDVAHDLALLDDHRYRFGLDILANEFLPHIPFVPRLDESHMADYHAGEAQRRSRFNVELVRELSDIFRPRLIEEDLMRVKKLEEQVIPVVCEMEKNGCPIDVEKLDRWRKSCEQDYLRLLYQINRETGVKFEVTTASWIKLFAHLNIPVTERTAATLSHPEGGAWGGTPSRPSRGARSRGGEWGARGLGR